MTLALVTGASGFIGAHVVRALLAEGVAVRALVRPGHNAAALAGLGIETTQGDVTDAVSVQASMSEVDVVFHLAARYMLEHSRAAEARAVNVHGTRVVMDAALKAGVARVVHTSSVAAVGHASADGAPADEGSWTDTRSFAGPYEASKYASERLVQRMVAQEGLPAVVVNPTAPIGPLDLKPTPTGQLILDAARGSMPGYVTSAGLNVVHVRDVARGHVLAWQRGVVGERYILGHQEGNLTLRSIQERAAAQAGRSGPRWRIPYVVALAYAHADERLLSGLRGGRVRAPVAGVRLARHRMWFDCRKAVEQLGMPQTPLAEAFRDAVDDFAARGVLARAV